MVRAKCGRLPHFDHTPPHTHHKVWRKCGRTESIGIGSHRTPNSVFFVHNSGCNSGSYVVGVGSTSEGVGTRGIREGAIPRDIRGSNDSCSSECL